MGKREGRGKIGERTGGREDQREDRSNSYLSAPDPLLDTQGPILSPTEPDTPAELALRQGCLLSISFAKPFQLLHLSVLSALFVLMVPGSSL